MTALERMEQLVSDLRKKGIIVHTDRTIYRDFGEKAIFVIGLTQVKPRMQDAQTIRDAIKAEFPEITSFTCVKEAVGCTIIPEKS